MLWAAAAFLGPCATNNVAEYNAAVLGCQAAATIEGVRALHCRGDSRLVICQVTGQWTVRQPHLVALRSTLSDAICRLDGISVSWEHRARRFNWQADALANIAVDRGRQGVTQALELRGVEAVSYVGALAPPLNWVSNAPGHGAGDALARAFLR